jgi:glycosyltransferase involved in cell wall biosynthesis
MTKGQAGATHVNEIVAGLNDLGWNVRLLALNYASNKPSILARVFKIGLIQMRLWWGYKGGPLYIRSHFAALPTSLVAWAFGIKTIVEVNGTTDDLNIAWPNLLFANKIFGMLSVFQIRLSSGVISVTEGLVTWIKEVAPKSVVTYIPNGANSRLFCPVNPNKNIIDSKSYVIFYGALARWQGVPTILAALKSDLWPIDIKLLIVGDGVLADLVDASARNDNRISRLGPIEYEKLPPIICSALAVLSVQSGYENRSKYGLLPLKFMEGMACGVPVIVSDCPGMADIVREMNCGIVVSPDDPESLAKAVNMLSKDSNLCANMGLNGRRAIESRFSWQRSAELTGYFIRKIGKI